MNGLLASQLETEMDYENVTHRKADMFLEGAEEVSLAYISSVFMHECSIQLIADIDPQHSVKAGQLQRHLLGFEMPMIH